MSNQNFTREDLGQIRRVVVKIGSALLANTAHAPFDRLATGIAALRAQNIQVVLVSSGAIAQGLPILGLKERPGSLSQLQALAAAGQPELMRRWAEALKPYNIPVAQVLLTHAGLADRERFINARHALLELERVGVLPIGNENDTVATDEIKVGDNDNLAAHIANLVDADLLILLTDVDGLFDKNPEEHSDATRLPTIENVKEAFGFAGKSGSSGLGVGGMQTKIEAAQTATKRGVPVVIANGEHDGILQEILGGKDVGTLFVPQTKMGSRKHWIGYTLRSSGTIHVDAGAAKALIEHGKSLLPSGIIRVEGDFERGAMVEVHGPHGLIARGLTAYSESDLNKIQGLSTDSIEEKLGYIHSPEAVHRDDLTLVD